MNILELLGLKKSPERELKQLIKMNPIGLEIYLYINSLDWEKVGIRGDIHISKYFQLNYKGLKNINDAIRDLNTFLSSPHIKEELNSLKEIEKEARKRLFELDADAQININTRENPVYITLDHKWEYCKYGVSVSSVSGENALILNNKSYGVVSFQNMLKAIEQGDIIEGTQPQGIMLHLAGGGEIFVPNKKKK